MDRRSHTLRDTFSYRHDPAIPSFPDDRPIFIFDGKCRFCSWSAQFVLRHDRRRLFRLLPAQTPLGEALYVHYGLDCKLYETNILLENGRAWFKSDASIRILERLGFPWSFVIAGRMLPRPFRDWLYDIFARNRLRWFGASETCFLPTPDEAGRFLA